MESSNLEFFLACGYHFPLHLGNLLLYYISNLIFVGNMVHKNVTHVLTIYR